jgi:hypothetical protein
MAIGFEAILGFLYIKTDISQGGEDFRIDWYFIVADDDTTSATVMRRMRSHPWMFADLVEFETGLWANC